jgi:hypothetical protein
MTFRGAPVEHWGTGQRTTSSHAISRAAVARPRAEQRMAAARHQRSAWHGRPMRPMAQALFTPQREVTRARAVAMRLGTRMARRHGCMRKSSADGPPAAARPGEAERRVHRRAFAEARIGEAVEHHALTPGRGVVDQHFHTRAGERGTEQRCLQPAQPQRAADLRAVEHQRVAVAPGRVTDAVEGGAGAVEVAGDARAARADAARGGKAIVQPQVATDLDTVEHQRRAPRAARIDRAADAGAPGDEVAALRARRSALARRIEPSFRRVAPTSTPSATQAAAARTGCLRAAATSATRSGRRRCAPAAAHLAGHAPQPAFSARSCAMRALGEQARQPSQSGLSAPAMRAPSNSGVVSNRSGRTTGCQHVAFGEVGRPPPRHRAWMPAVPALARAIASLGQEGGAHRQVGAGLARPLQADARDVAMAAGPQQDALGAPQGLESRQRVVLRQ